MRALEYITEIQRQLISVYGYPEGESGCPQGVPDGQYPMTIEGRIDNVRITGGKISCCNFEPAEHMNTDAPNQTPKTHTCPTCGFQWGHGQDGNHFCEHLLTKQLEEARAELTEAKAQLAQVTQQRDDYERWMREMLVDYRIPFDDHTAGRRLALNGFIHDLHEQIQKGREEATQAKALFDGVVTQRDEAQRELADSLTQNTPTRAAILQPANCGVPGHFRFQENGGHCTMCQQYVPREQLQAAQKERDELTETCDGYVLREQVMDSRFASVAMERDRLSAELEGVKKERDALKTSLTQARAYHHGECREFKGEGLCNCFVMSVGLRDAEKYNTALRDLRADLDTANRTIAEMRQRFNAIHDEAHGRALIGGTAEDGYRTALKISAMAIDALSSAPANSGSPVSNAP